MIALLAIVCHFSLSAQSIEVYPTNWFVQMKYNKVQILLRKTSSFKTNANVQVSYPGVRLIKTHYFKNPNYIAVDVEISTTAKPGDVKLIIQEGAIFEGSCVMKSPTSHTPFTADVSLDD